MEKVNSTSVWQIKVAVAGDFFLPKTMNDGYVVADTREGFFFFCLERDQLRGDLAVYSCGLESVECRDSVNNQPSQSHQVHSFACGLCDLPNVK